MNTNTRDLQFLNYNAEEMQWVKFNNVIVYESWKNLIVNGVPPLTLLNCKGVNLVDYKIYGNSVQNFISMLPSEYQQVEYIESTGEQYIDTLLKGTNKTEVELEMQYTDVTTSTSTRLFGARTGTTKAVFLGGYSATSSLLYVNFNSNGFATAGGGIELLLEKHNIKIKNGTVYVDDKVIFTGLNTTTEFITDYNLILCGGNTTGDIACAKAKYFNCKIWDNGVLLREFIPCYRKFDNVVGMYDLVNDKFYSNEGTSEFLKGKDVNAIEFVGDKTKNELDINNRTVKNNAVKPDTFIDFSTPFIFKDFAPSGYNIGRVTELTIENGVITWTNRANWYGIGFSFKPKVGVSYKISYKQLSNNELNPGVAYYSNGYFTRYGNSSKILLEEGETDAIVSIRSSTVDTSSISNLQVEEGETTTEYEPYGYKIPVKVSPPNLLNGDTVTHNYYLNSDGEPVKHTSNSSGKYWCYSDYIEVKENTEYIFTTNVYGEAPKICMYNQNKEFIGSVSQQLNFTTIAGTKYIRLNVFFPFDGTALYETGLEPIITNIYLDEPLRKIEDYTDYIDFKNKKVVRYIYNEFLTSVTAKSSLVGNYSIFLTDISKTPYMYESNGGTGYAISNKFKTHILGYGTLNSVPNSIQSYITTSGINRVAYTFRDNSITTIDQAQEKIGEGFDVCYVLETPIEETIELPNIPTIKGTTILEVDTKIQPSNAEIIYKGKE